MSKNRDYEWLLRQLKFIVYNNTGQADQAYANNSATDPNYHLREALNAAYENEVEEAKSECGFDPFRRTEDFVWPASQVVLELPATLVNKQGLAIRDITTFSDGDRFIISSSPDEGTVWRKDYNKLQWGTTGPESERTLRFFYLADAEHLGEVPSQQPLLIPYKFRWLIVWRAGKELELVGNLKAPQAWEAQAADIRSNYHKFLSRSFTLESTPKTIRNTDYSF